MSRLSVYHRNPPPAPPPCLGSAATPPGENRNINIQNIELYRSDALFHTRLPSICRSHKHDKRVINLINLNGGLQFYLTGVQHVHRFQVVVVADSLHRTQYNPGVYSEAQVGHVMHLNNGGMSGLCGLGKCVGGEKPPIVGATSAVRSLL